MPHGNQSESECLLGGKIGKIGKIPGILRVYLEKPGYTRVIPALLHGFAPGTTPTAATTNENPAYHFRIPLYHTTPKLIKISPNTGLIPVKFAHCAAHVGPAFASRTKRSEGPDRLKKKERRGIDLLSLPQWTPHAPASPSPSHSPRTTRASGRARRGSP